MEGVQVSDSISGIKNIKPAYPLKPVAPTPRDRESGKRKKNPPTPDAGKKNDGGDKPVIDEYI